MCILVLAYSYVFKTLVLQYFLIGKFIPCAYLVVTDRPRFIVTISLCTFSLNFCFWVVRFFFVDVVYVMLWYVVILCYVIYLLCLPSPLSHILCLLVWKLHAVCCKFYQRPFLYQNNSDEYVHVVANGRMPCSGGETVGSTYLSHCGDIFF